MRTPKHASRGISVSASIPARPGPHPTGGSRLRGEASLGTFLEYRNIEPQLRHTVSLVFWRLPLLNFYMNSNDPRGGGLPGSKNTAGVSWQPELVFPISIWTPDVIHCSWYGSCVCLSPGTREAGAQPHPFILLWDTWVLRYQEVCCDGAEWLQEPWQQGSR